MAQKMKSYCEVTITLTIRTYHTRTHQYKHHSSLHLLSSCKGIFRDQMGMHTWENGNALGK